MFVMVVVALDAMIGDPPSWPHPVRLMGGVITAWERFSRRFGEGEHHLRRMGAVLALGLPLATFLVVQGVILGAFFLHPWIGVAVAGYLGFASLAAGALFRAVGRVGSLMEGDLTGARRAVGEIVGRDTDTMTPEQVAGAAVESAAENASDGIIAPLFYLCLGGPALALAYKAVNTADSMIGHRNQRYLHFGRWAARVDDVANWIPARLTALLIVLSALGPVASARNAWRVARRDARAHASPNAGWPEAAMAGALRISLGGDARYGGALHRRPVLGGEGDMPTPRDVFHATRFLWGITFWGVALCGGLTLLA